MNGSQLHKFIEYTKENYRKEMEKQDVHGYMEDSTKIEDFGTFPSKKNFWCSPCPISQYLYCIAIVNFNLHGNSLIVYLPNDPGLEIW